MTCIIDYFAYRCLVYNNTFTQSLLLTFGTPNKLDLLVYLLENMSQKLNRLILYKAVAYYEFTMACIQFVFMIYLSEQVRLIELETEQV